MAKLKLKPLLTPVPVAPVVGNPPRRSYTIRWRWGESLLVCDEDNDVLAEGSALLLPPGRHDDFVGRPLAEFVQHLIDTTKPWSVEVLPHLPWPPSAPKKKLKLRLRKP